MKSKLFHEIDIVRTLGDLTLHFVTQKNRSVRLLVAHYSFNFKVEARCRGRQAPCRADCIPLKTSFLRIFHQGETLG